MHVGIVGGFGVQVGEVGEVDGGGVEAGGFWRRGAEALHKGHLAGLDVRAVGRVG